MPTFIGTGSTNQPSATVSGSNPTLRDTGRDISLEGRVVPEFLPQKENSVIRGIPIFAFYILYFFLNKFFWDC